MSMILLNKMTRQQKAELLERHGYGVYDSESEASLDNTILQDLESGEIDESELEPDQRPPRPMF